MEESRLTSVGNALLREQIASLLPASFPLAIDCTDIPYHGQPLLQEAEVVRGQAKDGTTHKHRYITAYVPVEGRRFTLAAFELYADEKPIEGLRKTLQELEAHGLLSRVSVVLADKGFYAKETVRILNERGLPFVLPVPVKAKRIREWCAQPLTAWRKFEIGGATGVEPVDLALVHLPHRGKKGPATFAYATRGPHEGPRAVHDLYLTRGGIETSYRLLNKARARTSSRSRALRYLYVLIALVLQNTWAVCKALLKKRRKNSRARPLTFLSFLYETLQHPRPSRNGGRR